MHLGTISIEGSSKSVQSDSQLQKTTSFNEESPPFSSRKH